MILTFNSSSVLCKQAHPNRSFSGRIHLKEKTYNPAQLIQNSKRTTELLHAATKKQFAGFINAFAEALRFSPGTWLRQVIAKVIIYNETITEAEYAERLNDGNLHKAQETVVQKRHQ